MAVKQRVLTYDDVNFGLPARCLACNPASNSGAILPRLSAQTAVVIISAVMHWRITSSRCVTGERASLIGMNFS